MARLSLPSLQRIQATLAPELKSAMFLTIALTGAIIIALVFSFFSAQPQVPMFYSLAQANQQLASKVWLFLFGGISISITVVHLSLILSFRQLDLFLLRLFIWTTVLIQTLLLMALLRIIFVIA